ncbi:MAG: twin-arginine translocation signal domain-containing protein [Dehalococcoidia bacterium]|nr:twin-arginine translocation signal domain-containing protein [Dehalococcoidia bacterium]
MATNSWQARYGPITRRRFLAGTAAGVGAAALIACGGSKEEVALKAGQERAPGAVLYTRDSHLWPDETKTAVAGGIYPGFVDTDNTAGFDPYLGASAETVSTDPYEYLLRKRRGPGIGPGSPEYLEMVPHLAQSYESSSDLTTYTFKLRRGVKFHPIAPVNGREMDIDDWRASYKRFTEVHPNRPNWLEVVDRVEFTDATTMVVKTKIPYFPFVLRGADEDFFFTIMPRELHEKPDLAATTPIGTNYRMLDKYQPSITQEYKRFDGYWQGKPFIDRWHLPIIPEHANRYAQFVAGNTLSFIPTLPEALDLRREVPEALMVAEQIQIDGITRSVFGHYEKTTVPWGDARVRSAMHRAVNWDAILNFETNKDKFAAAGIEIETAFRTHLPPDPAYWLDPRKGELGTESQNYLYDLAEAKKLVAAAGHANGFDMPLVAQQTSAGTDLWNLYHEEMKKAGIIRFEIDLMQNRTAYLDRVIRSANFKGIGWFSGAGGRGDVDYLVARNYHSSGQAAAYTSPKLDQLVEQSRTAPDWTKRAAVLKDMQIECAKVWPVQLANHPFAEWRFEWPWLHNANYDYPGYQHLLWLDGDMPRRNG